MAHLRQYRPFHLFRRRLLAILLLAAVILLGKSTWSIYTKARQAKENRIQAETRLAELEQRERNLSAQLADLETQRGMEAELREQFDVGRAGEGVIVLVDRSEPTTPPPPPAPWWRSLWPF